MESEEFSMKSEESSMESNEDGLKTEDIVVIVIFSLLCLFGCYKDPPCNYCMNKPDQENLETTERQDQVIKTYQIAKLNDNLGNGL